MVLWRPRRMGAKGFAGWGWGCLFNSPSSHEGVLEALVTARSRCEQCAVIKGRSRGARRPHGDAAAFPPAPSGRDVHAFNSR